MEYVVLDIQRRRDAALQRQRTLRLHRSLRDVTDPFNDPRFQSMYRFTPDMALGLIAEIRPHFPVMTTTAAIPVELKVLAALHFYSQGSYQKADGKDASINLSQASISRAVSQTTEALNTPEMLNKWIKFPSTTNEKQEIIQKNFRRFAVPGVLGYVDGTHILLKKPSEHEELYVNRKGQHSLNVQMVCDSDLVILNIVAMFPGSTHDAYVWKSSLVRDKMMELDEAHRCWFLGDSGYPLEPWLLTPILNAEPNSPEAHYTERHIASRNCIERFFGVLKARFRCVHKNRVLEYSPLKAGCIANACAVLHNMCVRAGLPEPAAVDLEEEPNQHVQGAHLDANEIYRRGLQVRADIINRL